MDEAALLRGLQVSKYVCLVGKERGREGRDKEGEGRDKVGEGRVGSDSVCEREKERALVR